DRYLTRKLIAFFLEKNRRTLGHVDGFDDCAASATMAEFHDRLYALAGFESREAFYRASNPMEVAMDVAVPVLVINAADDPVCVRRNVDRHVAGLQQLSRMSLAVTRHGGHCGFHERLRAAGIWTDHAISEYLAAAHAMLGA